MLKKSDKTNLSQNSLQKSATNLEKINRVKIETGIGTKDKIASKDDYTFSVPKKYKYLTNRTLLIGAPNVGKSTFFNHITNGTATVSNIDRMTVDTNWALIKKTKNQVLVDLPGVYNLSHPIDEELVVADMLMRGDYRNIINIIGAQSIERDLYLSIQCAETGLLNNIIINMVDEVDINKLDLDYLAKKLNGVNIIKAKAKKSKGIPKNIASLIDNKKCVNEKVITYSPDIEATVERLIQFIPTLKVSKRWVALMLLEGNKYVEDYLSHYFAKQYAKIKPILDEEKVKTYCAKIKDERLVYIQNIFTHSLKQSKEKYFKIDKSKQHKADHILLNKWIGIPLTILLLVAIYYITFGPYMGGSLQKLLADNFFNGIVIDKGLKPLFYDTFNTHPFFNELMINGIFVGLFSVLSFIPPIIILFFLLNLVNQVGILSRLSVLLDNTFNKVGLSGRAVLNLITGFGCNVPSIMASRSSNSKKERTIGILVAPFISCSARVIVYSFVCEAIFGVGFGWLAMILITLLGALIALMFGAIFSKTMFRKQSSFFFIEMVDWRSPDFRVIFKNVGLELWLFIKKAGTVILIANFAIWFLLHLGPTGIICEGYKTYPTYNNNDIGVSFIGYAGKGINYIMYPFGASTQYGWVGNEQGWKMTVSLISAFPAKEIALTNLNLLFANNVSAYVSAQVPIALSYLVILMLYLPCVATMRMMRKEAGWKALGIHLASSLSSAYVFGLITYWISYAICVH